MFAQTTIPKVKLVIAISAMIFSEVSLAAKFDIPMGSSAKFESLANRQLEALPHYRNNELLGYRRKTSAFSYQEGDRAAIAWVNPGVTGRPINVAMNINEKGIFQYQMPAVHPNHMVDKLEIKSIDKTRAYYLTDLTEPPGVLMDLREVKATLRLPGEDKVEVTKFIDLRKMPNGETERFNFVTKTELKPRSATISFAVEKPSSKNPDDGLIVISKVNATQETIYSWSLSSIKNTTRVPFQAKDVRDVNVNSIGSEFRIITKNENGVMEHQYRVELNHKFTFVGSKKLPDDSLTVKIETDAAPSNSPVGGLTVERRSGTSK